MADDAGDEVIAIAADGIAAGIAPLGAELRYLRDGDGRDLLWDGDPAFWTGRAPLLFPIVGAVRDDHYRLDDHTYALGKHGFARRSRFALVDRGADSALFRLEPNEISRPSYPFAFRLDMRFTTAGSAIEMTATLSNHGDRTLPASFGFHPALRWPLPYGQPRDHHRIVFAAAEPSPIRRLDRDGLIDPRPRPSPVADRQLVLEDRLFTDDAIIFDALRSRRLLYGALEGPRLAIDFPDMPMLGLWTKPGAGYICIEPWHGLADPAGFTGDIFTKPGILAIAPGACRAFTMRIDIAG